MNNQFDNGEEQKVDKIIFRPLKPEMVEQVKMISDPAPRPLPPKIDNGQAEDWTPDVADKAIKGQEIEKAVTNLGTILKYVIFSSLVVGSMGGLIWVVIWIMKQYNLLG